MQSTGHTSTHELSLVPMHGSAITYAIRRLLYKGVAVLHITLRRLLRRRSVGPPGLRVGGELSDRRGQLSGRHVRQGDVLEHGPQAGSDGHPDLLIRLGAAAVGKLLR